MQSILKRYIRQSISSWLRNEIRKNYEGKNKLDLYYLSIERVNSFTDKLADDTINNLEEELKNITALI